MNDLLFQLCNIHFDKLSSNLKGMPKEKYVSYFAWKIFQTIKTLYLHIKQIILSLDIVELPSIYFYFIIILISYFINQLHWSPILGSIISLLR